MTIIEELKEGVNGELEPKKVEGKKSSSLKDQKKNVLQSNDNNLETYMQIDGEYYKLINPEKITIRLCPQLSRLRVLNNND